MRAQLLFMVAILGWFATYVRLQNKVELLRTEATFWHETHRFTLGRLERLQLDTCTHDDMIELGDVFWCTYCHKSEPIPDCEHNYHGTEDDPWNWDAISPTCGKCGVLCEHEWVRDMDEWSDPFDQHPDHEYQYCDKCKTTRWHLMV